MNNIKLILILILLSLFLLQNIYVFYKEKFSLNGLDNYLDSQIGRLSLQHDLGELSISEDSNIKNISLHQDKLLLTLFYDRYDKYSAYFYDDTMKMSIKKINEIQGELKKEDYKQGEIDNINKLLKNNKIPILGYLGVNLYDNFVSAINNLRRRIHTVKDIIRARNKIEDTTGLTFTVNGGDETITLVGKSSTLYNELKIISDSIINQIMGISEKPNLDRNPDVKYNSKKARYEYKGEDSINEKLSNFEDKMYELQKHITITQQDINTNKSFYQKKIADELYAFNDKNKPGAWNQIRQIHKYGGDLYLHKNFFEISEVLCDVYHMDKCHIRTSDLYQGVDSVKETDEAKKENIGTYLTKNQPYRDDKLVDKLPKVILSFVTPFENEFKKHIYEYNGMYNYNDKFDNTSRDNILMFLQETIDKELVIGEYLEDIEAEVSEPCFSRKDKDEDKTITTHEWSESHEYNQRPFYYDYKLYKCKHCCYFLKEKL